MHKVSKRLNFAPGAADLTPRVLKAMMQQFVNPWNTEFLDYHDETVGMLKEVFGTQNDLITMMGPIRAAANAAISSVIEPKDKVILLTNDYWSEHMIEMVRASGGIPIILAEDWGSPYETEKLRNLLDKEEGAKAVIGVHVSTSTGIVNPVKEIGNIVKGRKTLFILDVAQSLGGIEVKADDWSVDLAISGNHKCMSAPAGLSYVTVSRRAWETMERRRIPVSGWYTNLLLWRELWIKRERLYFTFCSSLLFGLRAVLDWMFQQGLGAVYKKYEKTAFLIRKEVIASGLQVVPNCQECRGCDSQDRICADTATAIRLPEWINGRSFIEKMNKDHRISVGGGLGKFAGRIFRVGPTGEAQLIPQNVAALLRAIKSVLQEYKRV